VSADRPRRLPGGPPDPLPGGVPDPLPGGVPDPLPASLLEDIAASEPGLDALLGLLTAGPAPGELAGENAALAMFRNAQRPPAAEVAGPPASGPRPRAPRVSGRHDRRARYLAAAIALAAAAGFAVAAYTEALPAPLQQAAYHVLGFADVPDTHHAAPVAVGSHPARPTRAHSISRPGGGTQPSVPPAAPVAVGSHPARPTRAHSISRPSGRTQPSVPPASAQPTASSPAPAQEEASLAVAATSGRIVAGGSETFVGQLTGQGRAIAGANLTLLERMAGEPRWRLAGTATTGPGGSAVVTVPDLTRNALFRLTGPDGSQSRPVPVLVVPPVSARLATGRRSGADVLIASSPLAAPGDTVVLQVSTGKGWRTVQARGLAGAGQAIFPLRSPADDRVDRIVLLATADHGVSVSNSVTVPSR